MIITKIQAGLGNQMFQYATGLRLAKHNNTVLELDIRSFDNMDKNDTPRYYELDLLSISAKIATEDELGKIKEPDYKRNLKEKVKHRLGTGKHLFYYGENSPEFNPRILTLKDNTYLVGWWQSEQYFVDIADTLRKEFTPKRKPSLKNSKILEQALATNSVGIHVRRGDYVTNKYATAFHGLAPIDYYNAAVTFMKTYVDEAHFFVFSDDIKWCKANFKFGHRVTFVEGNDGPLAYEDLRIMAACKHNIIANSSFSWWGAWLNPNPEKIIIAPRIWYAEEDRNRKADIVPNNWMRL